VPHGFDDNDNVEIIVQGEFTDSCLRIHEAVGRVSQRRVEVSVRALRYPDADCVPMTTPFLLSARIGLLERGEYTVYVNGATEPSARFTVAESRTQAADEYFYAPVELVDLEGDESGRQELVLKGNYPLLYRGCAIMDRVQMYRNPADVLVVLPIMRIADGAECAGVARNFKVVEPMAEPFVGPGLVHVRVLNGASENRFVPATAP
jgi:hypothetical protein